MISRSRIVNCRGFTLIEVVMVIVIAGILATVALRSAGIVSDTAKVEETKQELNALAFAIVGNPDLQNNGVRSDFGYVGDIGAMPPNLDALHSNPGSYSTWKGPYIENRFSQITDDYKKDAWGEEYEYSAGITITSPGKTLGGGGCGGPTTTSGIVRKLANSVADLLQNRVSGVIYDLDGTPPGPTYKDSVSARLTIPDGSGSLAARTGNVDAGGYFSFDSIPIGNHDIEIIYQPDDDTLKRFVSVLPNSSLYGEYRLAANVWYDTTGSGAALSYITNSDTLETANCFKLVLWVTNAGSNPVLVNSLMLIWSSSTAYYKTVQWSGVDARSGDPALTSGSTANFTSPRTLNPGENVQIRIEEFHAFSSGDGPPVDMSNTTFTVEFSDGSSFSFEADLCNP